MGVSRPVAPDKKKKSSKVVPSLPLPQQASPGVPDDTHSEPDDEATEFYENLKLFDKCEKDIQEHLERQETLKAMVCPSAGLSIQPFTFIYLRKKPKSHLRKSTSMSCMPRVKSFCPGIVQVLVVHQATLELCKDLIQHRGKKKMLTLMNGSKSKCCKPSATRFDSPTTIRLGFEHFEECEEEALEDPIQSLLIQRRQELRKQVTFACPSI
jgi:hypothetical protein